MAIKKKISKSPKAAAKKPVKKAPAKKVVKKSAPKPAKKAPAKKTAPAKKAAPAKKSAPKKAVAKKIVKKVAPKKAAPAPKKAIVKPTAKKSVATAKAIKSAPKVVVKPVSKSVAPSKPTTSTKPVVKAAPAPQPVTRPAVNPSIATEVKKTVKETMTEKEISKPLVAQRYSDPELQEFKVLVVKKLEEAREELINLQAQIINANENGTDDTGASFKMLEDGSETLAKEEAANLAARQKKFIEQLEAALVRIENKTYGICRITGKLIPKERLRAVPHTTQSMEAKLKQYKD